MGAYKLGAYNLGPRIWDLEMYLLAWGPTAWRPTVSSHVIGIWHCTHLHGGLHLGVQLSRATDLGFCNALTCMGGYSLWAYSLGPRIWDLATCLPAWKHYIAHLKPSLFGETQNKTIITIVKPNKLVFQTRQIQYSPTTHHDNFL